MAWCFFKCSRRPGLSNFSESFVFIPRDKYEGFGKVRQARPSATFEKTPSQIIRPAPKLGEHGKEILDKLGINGEDQKRLSKEGKVIILE